MCGGRKGAAPDSQAATIPEGAQFSLIPGPASGAPQGVWCFCLSQLLGMAFPSSRTLGQDCVHPGNRILIPESLLQPFPHPLTHCLALFWGSSAIFHSVFFLGLLSAAQSFCLPSFSLWIPGGTLPSLRLLRPSQGPALMPEAALPFQNSACSFEC